jgi:hypothetical protein
MDKNAKGGPKMDLAIIKQALNELKKERALITAKLDTTIEGLEFLINQASDESDFPNKNFLPSLQAIPGNHDANPSYIDLAVEAISQAGTDLRVNDIFAYVSRRRPGIKRNALWSNLLSHVRKTGDKSRIVKSGKGTFGLRRAA